MKLMSGGDGVISRCEEVEISAPGATFGVVFWPYMFRNVIGWTRTMSHWKALAKTLQKTCKFLMCPDPGALRIVI